MSESPRNSYCITGRHVSSQFELPGAISPSTLSWQNVTIVGTTVLFHFGGCLSSDFWEGADTSGQTGRSRRKIPLATRSTIGAPPDPHGRGIDVGVRARCEEPSYQLRAGNFVLLLHQRGALFSMARRWRAMGALSRSRAAGAKSTSAAALCQEGCSCCRRRIRVRLKGHREPIVQSDGCNRNSARVDRTSIEQAARRRGTRHLSRNTSPTVPDDRAAETFCDLCVAIWPARALGARPISKASAARRHRTLKYEAYRPGLCANRVEAECSRRRPLCLASESIFALPTTRSRVSGGDGRERTPALGRAWAMTDLRSVGAGGTSLQVGVSCKNCSR